MGLMGILLGLLSLACFIGWLVCFIMVVVKMFQNNQTTMGIVCIVTFFLCFIGVLVALVVGWMNAGKWKIQQLMMIYTGCVVGSLILQVIGTAMGIAMGGTHINVNTP